MAEKPKAPEQDSTPAVPDADILPEGQQPEQTETPPFEMGELFPDPGEVVIPADLTEQLLADKNGAKIAAAKEAAAAEMPAPEEDTRQEWEKPLAEIEAEQQPKRKGRPPKATEDKETSGQVGPKSDKPVKAEKTPKQPKPEKAAKPPKEEKANQPPAPPEPETPPEPIDATRPGEVEQIV